MAGTSDQTASSWRTLAPTVVENALPPPGDYQGAVIAAKLIDKPTELWLQITFGLRDFAEEIRQLHCYATASTSPHRHRATDGKRAVNRLLMVGKRELTTADPFALPELLTGIRVTLTIAHKVLDGVPELVIRNIAPANPEA